MKLYIPLNIKLIFALVIGCNFFCIQKISAQKSNDAIRVQGSPLKLERSHNFYKTVLNAHTEKSADIIQSTVFIQASANDNTQNCTGVIVSEQLILTAGHCFFYDSNGNKISQNVKVRFGSGKEFISHYRNALSFETYYKPPASTSGKGPWIFDKNLEHDVLDIDYDSSKKFREDFANMILWQNYDSYINYLYDVALIKIKDLPEGFKPVKIFRGEVQFKQSVKAAGFGVSSVNKPDALRYKLRSSDLQLMGQLKSDANTLAGYAYYSDQDKNICFGDSGGPIYIKNLETNNWELLAINNVTINKCSEVGIGFSPLHPIIKSVLDQWTEKFIGEVIL